MSIVQKYTPASTINVCHRLQSMPQDDILAVLRQYPEGSLVEMAARLGVPQGYRTNANVRDILAVRLGQLGCVNRIHWLDGKKRSIWHYTGDSMRMA